MSELEKRETFCGNTIGRIALLAVPLFFALSELFHPITQSTVLGEINSAMENYSNWILSHVLALIAILFLPFLIQKLACYIDGKQKTLLLGMTLSYIGVIGITGYLAYDFMLLDAWRVGNNEIIAKYLEILNSSVFGLMFLLIGSIIFFLGFLILVVLMLISSKIKKLKTILILIGLLIYALAGPLIPVPNGHILVSIGAFIMLAGFAGVLYEEIKATG